MREAPQTFPPTGLPGSVPTWWGRSAGLVIRPFPAYVSNRTDPNIHLQARCVTGAFR